MTSVGAVARQIAALEISSKKQGTTTTTSSTTASSSSSSSSLRSLHTKKPSQALGKQLAFAAAPHPLRSNTKPPQPSSLRHNTTAPTRAASVDDATPQSSQLPQPPKPQQQKPKPIFDDIGGYDGGLERDEERRGEPVFGEAAIALALDSSVARYVFYLTHTPAVSHERARF